MRNLLILTLFLLSASLPINSVAKDKEKTSGVDTSVEHKSEQGLEQGKAYAGTKEKKEKEEKEKKSKKDKKDKKDKDKKDKKDKGSKEKKSKKGK